MLNFLHYVILMLTSSIIDAQYFDAKFVPKITPPEDYYIDISITFKKDGTVVLKKERPVIAKTYNCYYNIVELQLYLSGEECDDMVSSSGGQLTPKSLNPLLSEDHASLFFYQTHGTKVTYTVKKAK